MEGFPSNIFGGYPPNSPEFNPTRRLFSIIQNDDPILSSETEACLKNWVKKKNYTNFHSIFKSLICDLLEGSAPVKGPATGKLERFLMTHRPDHYEALLQAG